MCAYSPQSVSTGSVIKAGLDYYKCSEIYYRKEVPILRYSNWPRSGFLITQGLLNKMFKYIFIIELFSDKHICLRSRYKIAVLMCKDNHKITPRITLC